MERKEIFEIIAYIIFVAIMMTSLHLIYKYKTSGNISNIESEIYQQTYPYQED